MDLLNNPRGWGVSLLKNALVWEVPRMCVGAFVRWKYGKGKDATEKEKEFVDCASSYVISAVHAVVISGLGLKILSLLWDVPAHDKFYVNDTMTDFSTIDLIERANWLFFGYMMDDLVHVLVQYPKLGKMDMVAHHLVFIICAILAGGTQIFVFPFAWLLIGELSTPLLTAKWFMRQMASANSPTLQKIAAPLGQPHATCTEAAAAMELLVAKVFILVFFLGSSVRLRRRPHAHRSAPPRGNVPGDSNGALRRGAHHPLPRRGAERSLVQDDDVQGVGAGEVRGQEEGVSWGGGEGWGRGYRRAFVDDTDPSVAFGERRSGRFSRRDERESASRVSRVTTSSRD